MKNIVKIAAVSVLLGLLVLVLAVWIRTDEPLSPTAKKLLISDLFYHSKLKQHPYFDFLGLDAKDGLSPHIVGHYRYHQDWSRFYRDINGEKELPFDTGLNQKLTRAAWHSDETELMKSLSQSMSDVNQFAQAIQQHESKLRKLIQREQLPLQRLDQLYARDNYISLPMHALAESANTPYLRFLHILKLADIQLNHTDRITAYQGEFELAQRFLNNRLGLVEKMTVVSYLHGLIDLIRQEQMNRSSAKIQLATLDAMQLSLESALQNEAMGIFLYLVSLPNTYPNGAEQSQWTYLPYQTFNVIAERYDQILRLSHLSYIDFQQQMAQPKVLITPEWWLKNSVGKQIAAQELPEFESYVLRMHVLNNKIMAFNAVNQAVSLQELNQNFEGRQFSIVDGQLCVDIPHPDPSRFRLKNNSCVKI